MCRPPPGSLSALEAETREALARPDQVAQEAVRQAPVQNTAETGWKAAAFCANVLALYPWLWLFTTIAGVEPTNNDAERILRLGVLWWKNAFDRHSTAGRQFVERMLTVVQTLRLQTRPVLDYLYRALVAHRASLPAPQLRGQAGD